MTKRTKGCLWIALGVTALLIMVAVAIVGGLGYVLYHQVGLRSVVIAPVAAQQELDAIRQRFVGQKPRLQREKGEDGEDRLTFDRRPPANAGALTALHIVIFDPSVNKFVHVKIPFWMVRLLPEGDIRMHDDNELLRKMRAEGRFSPRELEALGPGLLIDEREPDGQSLVVWTE
jgi:hypothetical protein